MKEAASRVYEDKLAHIYAESSTRELQRQMSKQRIQKHIHDIKHKRTNGEYLRIIRQSQDRPMSEWENVISSLTRVHPPLPDNDLTSHIPSFRATSAIAQEIAHDMSVHIAELPAAPTTARALLPPLVIHSPPQRTVAQPLIPTPSSSTVSTSPGRTVAQPLLPTPSVSAYSASPRRMVAQPLLLTPSGSTWSGTVDRRSIASAMPSIVEHPMFLTQSPTQLPFPDHPAFSSQRPHARKETDISLSSRGSSDSGRTDRSGGPAGAHHPAFQQHQAQVDIFDSPAYENTADKAIYRIMEMGFTADEAKEALMKTDLGDGLRVDRAVEMLLSRHM